MNQNTTTTEREEDFRRIKRVLVDPEIFGQFCRTGEAWQCIDGLPADAKFLGVYASHESICITLGFEHESFEPVHISRMGPTFIPTFKRVLP